MIRQIQSFPINTTLTAVYGLLGFRPIEQELDLRKLILLKNVFLNKDSLEYENAQRQLAVKSYESKSWVSVCNRLLHKYKLPSIYNVCKNIESMKIWKQLVNAAIITYVLSQWMDTPKKSLIYLNITIESLQVGKVHQSWSSLPNDPVAVKRSIPKLRRLTGSYILQENRARFNQYNIDATYALCGDGHESGVHFLVVCSRLQFVRQNYIGRLKGMLYLENSEIIADSYISDPEKLTQIILDCSVCGARGVLKLGKETVMNIERLSRNLCYAYNKCRGELLWLQTKY